MSGDECLCRAFRYSLIRSSITLDTGKPCPPDVIALWQHIINKKAMQSPVTVSKRENEDEAESGTGGL